MKNKWKSINLKVLRPMKIRLIKAAKKSGIPITRIIRNGIDEQCDLILGKKENADD